jgi:two-component system, NtrC family, sensor kinase
MKRLYIFLFIVAPLSALSQPYIKTADSLKRELSQAQTHSSRLKLLTQLINSYGNRDFDSAILFARQRVQVAKQTSDEEEQLESQRLLAGMLAARDYSGSMKLYLQTLRLAQKQNYTEVVKNCLFGIGILHIFLQNPRQAIQYFRQAKTMAINEKDTDMTFKCNLELAGSFILLQRLDSARYYLKMNGPATKHNSAGLIYWAILESKSNPALARAYFQQIIKNREATGDLRGLSIAYRRLSEFYKEQNQPDSGIIAARKGLQVAQKMNFLRGIVINSIQLTNAFRARNQSDSVYKYLSILVPAQDSIYSPAKINQVHTALFEEQQRVQQLEEEKTQLKFYGLLLLISGLLAIAGILYRNNHHKQKANVLLQRQRDEINSQRTQLQHSLEALQSTQSQLIQKEKLASLGELTAGIAHEIQNPLNFVNNYSEVNMELIEELQQEAEKGDTEEIKSLLTDLSDNEHKIHHHGRRADAIVRGMLEHARASPGEKVPTDLNALADEYLRLAYHGLRAKDPEFQCELITDFDPNLGRVAVAPSELGRVLLNLFNNAFYAVRQRVMLVADQAYTPTVWVSTTKLPLLAGEGRGGRRYGEVKISVRDNGTGMPEEVQAKIFQPFFTTKPTGEGTGLGLSLSYDIVTKGHGGALRVESCVGEGTEFVVELPVG